MFTGIIEDLGKVESLIRFKDRISLTVSTKFAKELKTGDSVSVNGVCLTVAEKTRSGFKADIIAETYKVTNLNYLKVGDFLNLERAMLVNGRLNGHIVQGHVDSRSFITNIYSSGSLREIEIAVPEGSGKYIAGKGSIAVDGVSLTVANVRGDHFNVAIIPHTALHTNLFHKKIGDYVNLEFDVIAKHLASFIKGKEVKEWTMIKDMRIDENFLKSTGFMN